MSRWWVLFRKTATSWANHNAARLGAALAYYSIFSLGPLLVIAISVAGLFFDADATRDAVSGQLQSLLGESGAKAVNSMLAGAAGHSMAGKIPCGMSKRPPAAASGNLFARISCHWRAFSELDFCC